MTGHASVGHWPESPYRGLNYYRPQDRALFAGRDRDIALCTAQIAHPETRVLLLHGMTGCGKSSFLRAGLIPTMEEEGAGYLFLKVPGGDDEALFIRCTDAPMDQIARQVYLFATEPYPLRTPIGARTIDLTPALLGKTEWLDFLSLVREEERLADSLEVIARLLPKTLVLIVDQGEEVLTLEPGEQGMENRHRFFRFLRDFQGRAYDGRIVVALRTEFHGRFFDALQIAGRALPRCRHYLLHDLTKDALVEAIARPTRRDSVSRFGTPYESYRFAFHQGLPEKIADDVFKAKYSGAALPILQLVCRGLYDDAIRSRGKTEIALSDFDAKEGVEGIIIEHIQSSLKGLYTSHDRSIFDSDFEKVIEFLRDRLKTVGREAVL